MQAGMIQLCTSPLTFILLSFLLLSLTRTCFCFTTTISGGYTLEPNTCVFLEPGLYSEPTFPLATTHWGEVSGDGNPSDSVIIQIRPSYRFDGSTYFLGFTEGPIYVPDKVTIPWPYCGDSSMFYSPITLQPDWPTPTTPGCEGLLLYGYESIATIAQDNTMGFNSSIIGISVNRLDGGYPSPWRGTITWIRPTLCLTPNLPTVRVLLNTTGLDDIDDITPLAYTDSATSTTKYCPVYGLGCGRVPRPPDSIKYDPVITLQPICKQILAFDSSYSLSDYEAIMGVGMKGPQNVPQNAIVYQLKVDNLPPSVAIQVRLKFGYVNDTSLTIVDTIVGPYYVTQDTVYFIPSLGTYPAIVSAQYYNDVQPFKEVWNEAKLLYLDRCRCGPTNATSNIVCDSDPNEPSMISPVVRTTELPTYPDATPYSYVDAASCAFYINNGDPVYKGIIFSVTSYVVTDTVGATITYLWQVAGAPQDKITITSPTAATTNVIVDVVGIVTLNFTVTLTLPGDLIPHVRNCSQRFQILTGAPTASLTPSSATIPLVTFLVLDGSASTTPAPFGPLSWQWSISLSPPGGGGTLSSTTLPIITFSGSIAGVYIVTMKVSNNVGTSTLSSVINVGAGPQPVLPPESCYNASEPPFNFVVPTQPSPSPITPVPSPIEIPVPVGNGGILGPIAAIPASAIPIITATVMIIIVLLVCVGFFVTVRRNARKAVID